MTCASALQSSSTTNDVESPLVEDSTQSPTAEHTSPATAEAEPQHSEGTASTTASQSTSSASEIRGSASTPRTPMVGSRVSRGPRPVFQPDEDGVDGPAATIDGTLVPEASRWFRNGDVVVGKILWSNNRGARVQLVADPRITAYMPAKEGPYTIISSREEETFLEQVANGGAEEPCLPRGLIREFQVLKVPADMQYNGRGPLVSARLVDLDLLWGRAEQLLGACTEDRENISVVFQECNEGGLMTRFNGLQLFLPASFLVKGPSVHLSAAEMKEKMCGHPMSVTITQANPYERRFTASQRVAEYNTKVSAIKVGGLISGTVRRIDTFGCFVGLDDMGKVSGLLHISNVSRVRVEKIEDVFRIGDKVRAVILGMDEDFTRISLSTAELEETDGDMVEKKAYVFEHAEEQHTIFLEQAMQDSRMQERLNYSERVRVNSSSGGQ